MYLSMKTARGGQYVPSLFFRFSKLTAVLMPTDASTAAITVVGTWTDRPSSNKLSIAYASNRQNCQKSYRALFAVSPDSKITDVVWVLALMTGVLRLYRLAASPVTSRQTPPPIATMGSFRLRSSTALLVMRDSLATCHTRSKRVQCLTQQHLQAAHASF